MFGFDDAFSAILQYQGVQDTNASNRDIHNADNAFNAQQYATRYQTQVKDMEAAGLNPMLAYGLGAGSGASANTPPVMQNSLGSAVEAVNRSQERKLAAAQTEKVLADADVSRNQAALIAAQTANVQEEERVNRGRANASALELVRNQSTNTTAALAASYWSQVEVNKANLPKIASEIVYNRAGAAAARANAFKAIQEGKITQADYDRALNEQKMQRSSYGAVRPYLRDAGETARGLAGAVGSMRKPSTVVNKSYTIQKGK